MRFWDTSALIPLVLPESTTRLLEREYDVDSEIAVWWGTLIECQSAIERRARLRELDVASSARAKRRLDELRANWREIQPDDAVREEAIRLLATYPLRAADALQLAAALVLAGTTSASLEFVCLDSRLLEAARSERFRIGNWYPPLI